MAPRKHNPTYEQRGGIAKHINYQFARLQAPYTFEHDIEPFFQLGVPSTKIHGRIKQLVSYATVKKWRKVYDAEQLALQTAAARKEFADEKDTNTI